MATYRHPCVISLMVNPSLCVINPLKPIGYTIRNAKFSSSLWISEQTAIISLYSINWLVFITDTECVYCAVWTGYFNKIQATVRV